MSIEEVIALMKTSTCEASWDRNCDLVKRACGGNYPDFWYGAIVISGLMSEIFNKFLPI